MVTRMDSKFEPLATYNAERARGIVHTAEYDARMAELQREFDAARPVLNPTQAMGTH
jgi:hypothetical protein